MTDKQIQDALIDLRMLWGDREWWECELHPVTAAEVRETLKAAIDALEALRARGSWYLGRAHSEALRTQGK